MIKRASAPGEDVVVLSTKSALRRALAEVFGDPHDRRIAIVAFVGADAAELLPKPKGATVICWPHPVGTNPQGVRRLLKAKARVFFADNLHIKLYWSQRRGSIVGSANLSANGLRDGGLTELCVRLRPGMLDGSTIARALKTRAVGKKELRELDRRYGIVCASLAAQGGTLTGAASPQSFVDWLESPMPAQWKIVTFEQNTSTPTEVSTDFLVEVHGTSMAKNWNQVKSGIYEEGDWALQVKCDPETKSARAKVRWFHVDHVVSNAWGKKNRLGSDELVQRNRLANYGLPPFQLTHHFQRAFRSAFDSLELRQALTSDHQPTKRLLRAIHRHLSKTT